MELRQRLIIVVAVLGAVTLGAAGGIAVPAGLQMRSLVGEIRAARQEIDARFAAQRRIRGSMANFGAIMEKTAGLSSVAVREGRELDLITAIEVLAEARDVDLKLFLEAANQKELSPWEKEIPLRIEATGDFDDVTAFLNDVERFPYLISVSTLVVSAPRTQAPGEDGRITAVFNGTVYWHAATAPDFAGGPVVTANGNGQ